VEAIHSIGIMHRDLKPENILLDRHCHVKICDFGLACVRQEPLTAYVVTRWYRAPEVMMCDGSYDLAADMWSVGCIFAEMMNGGLALFRGENWQDQLRLISRTFEVASTSEIAESCMAFIRNVHPDMATDSPLRLEDLVPTCSDQAIDLLRQLMTIEPLFRLTAPQAIQHPFLELERIDHAIRLHDHGVIQMAAQNPVPFEPFPLSRSTGTLRLSFLKGQPG